MLDFPYRHDNRTRGTMPSYAGGGPIAHRALIQSEIRGKTVRNFPHGPGQPVDAPDVTTRPQQPRPLDLNQTSSASRDLYERAFRGLLWRAGVSRIEQNVRRLLHAAERSRAAAARQIPRTPLHRKSVPGAPAGAVYEAWAAPSKWSTNCLDCAISSR